jgi:conjugative transfer signal peptidase TraF
MNNMTAIGRSALLRCGGAAVALVAATHAFASWAGILVNTTPSMPLGLYVTSSDPDAPVAAICLPEPYGSFAIRRGYRTAGSCADGATPLMKPVVAKAGDVVELSPNGIAVNGTVVPNTQPLSHDSTGRPLTPWAFGRFTVSPGTVWVASSHHPRSYDSRYFGPIPTCCIRSHVRPLLTAW